MLIYYTEELRQIGEGESPHKLLGRPLINRLMELGILTHYTRPGRGRGTTLSPKGRLILGLPDKEPDPGFL